MNTIDILKSASLKLFPMSNPEKNRILNIYSTHNYSLLKNCKGANQNSPKYNLPLKKNLGKVNQKYQQMRECKEIISLKSCQ